MLHTHRNETGLGELLKCVKVNELVKISGLVISASQPYATVSYTHLTLPTKA